jgi:hypothetical protein
MKGEVQITMEDGSIFKGFISMVGNGTQGNSIQSLKSDPIHVPQTNGQLDYSLPIRPFISKYATRMSGSKKLTLIVAHFAKGELDVHVDRTSVVDAWSKMTGLLNGKFNPAHETRAKDSGWVYVPESGQLALLLNWKEIFS